MKITKADILRIRTLLTVAQNKSKDDNIVFMEGYLQALKDYQHEEITLGTIIENIRKKQEEIRLKKETEKSNKESAEYIRADILMTQCATEEQPEKVVVDTEDGLIIFKKEGDLPSEYEIDENSIPHVAEDGNVWLTSKDTKEIGKTMSEGIKRGMILADKKLKVITDKSKEFSPAFLKGIDPFEIVKNHNKDIKEEDNEDKQ